MIETTEKTHTIDATGQSLGRVASAAARILMGKDTPSFQRHITPDITVRIINASKVSLLQKKKEKEYTRYTGYPGGLRKESLASLIKRKGYSEALRRAVRGMLPNNRLRSGMLKRITIEE